MTKIYKTFNYDTYDPSKEFADTDSDEEFQKAVNHKVGLWFEEKSKDTEFSVPDCDLCERAIFLEYGYLSESLEKALNEWLDNCYGKIIFEYELSSEDFVKALTNQRTQAYPINIYYFRWNEVDKQLTRV